FIPTDNAFDAFLNANGYDGIESVDMENPDHAEFLITYVYNHITLETTERSVLESEGSGYLTTNTQQEIDMFFDATGESIVLNGVATVTKDTDARNGVVYIVDDVIPVPTLATFVEAHPDFEVMKQALAIAESEVGSTINSDLTNATQYTVLVPVDAAFESLYNEIKVNDISELEANIVEDVVEIHVIPNTNFDASDIEDAVGGSINTLTDVLDVDVDGDGYYTLTDPQTRTATLIRTDIRASNGFIHIIDRVLLGN
ncbi:MAG: fasciclin domain-containing protein, partial [Bacteroidota bacterium]